MLEKGFEVNFLTKTRVDKTKPNEDLILLEDDFYYPIETVFIGKNSSGKTTTLLLIGIILDLVKSGRIPASVLMDQDQLDIEFIFYHEGLVYNYHGVFKKDLLKNSAFLIIEDETLQKTTLKKNYKKDLSNIFFPKDSLFTPNVGGDTSCLLNLHVNDGSIMTDRIYAGPENFSMIIRVINQLYNNKIFNTLIRLFDDSIENIEPVLKDNMIFFKFKRINQKEILVDYSYLSQRMSNGTYRGAYIFAATLIAFNIGGHILIDEIEKSFNKNLVENLLALFNDETINKKGASLIYTTHYSELLDESDRCDNINVLHRNGDKISVKNMHTAYQVRTDLSKSNQFNQNAFDSILNYDQLMELRRMLLK